MDETVLQSLIKWPHVPNCFGWLALDRRGQWRMRNEYAQQHKLPGSPIEHTILNEFINRNYAYDEFGRYYFQNGPQRVFISLDATPWIARLIPFGDTLTIQTQCQSTIEPQSALSDESGNIYITGLLSVATHDAKQIAHLTNHAHIVVALLHDHDLDLFANLAQVHEDACSYKGSWQWNQQTLPIDPIHSHELETRFRFTKDPQEL